MRMKWYEIILLVNNARRTEPSFHGETRHHGELLEESGERIWRFLTQFFHMTLLALQCHVYGLRYLCPSKQLSVTISGGYNCCPYTICFY